MLYFPPGKILLLGKKAMKIKLLSSFLLISIASMNAYALEIKNGKLINHKEWKMLTSTKSLVEKTRTESLSASNMPQKQAAFSDSMLRIHNMILPAIGNVGESTKIESYQATLVFNVSDGTSVYRIERIICAEGFVGTSECLSTEDDFQLDPGGVILDSQTPSINLVFQKAGNPVTVARLMISIQDPSGKFTPISVADSAGYAIISESKSKPKT